MVNLFLVFLFAIPALFAFAIIVIVVKYIIKRIRKK